MGTTARIPARRAGAILALLLLGCLATSPAEAGCGLLGGSMTSHARLDLLEELSRIEPSGANSTPRSPASPCSGPSCSEKREGSDPILADPAATTPRELSDDSAPREEPDHAGSGRLAEASPPLRASHRPDALERPPRVSSARRSA